MTRSVVRRNVPLVVAALAGIAWAPGGLGATILGVFIYLLAYQLNGDEL